MHVLQVHTAYRQRGGEDGVVEEDAVALRGAGHRVSQEIVHNPESTAATFVALARTPYNTSAAKSLKAVVERLRPDVVHLHNTWFAMGPAAVAALRDLDVAVVMTLHNYRLICPAATLYHHGSRCHDCLEGGPWMAIRHRCYRDSAVLSGVAAASVAAWRRGGAIDAVDRFIALSPAGREMFIRGGLPADRLMVRPNAVADPGPRTAPPSAGTEVLYVGRAAPEKGLDDLLRWWATARPPMPLRVIGEGEVVDQWRGRAPEGVELAGARPREEVVAAMSSARALLIPSRWDEPYPLTAVEAMASGLPVVSSGLGGLTDIHGTDGGWITGMGPEESWPAQAWADALLGEDGVVVDDAVDRRGEAARRRYDAGLSMAHAADRLVAIYEDALTRGR